jgi:hypothetical protein
MKLDGHAKLTNSAIRAFKSRCSKSTDVFFREKMCHLPQFSTWDINWDGASSNENDNRFLIKYIIAQELAVFGELSHQIGRGYLAREVVAVDLELPLVFGHITDWGQKYHFMRRAEGATVKDAHREAIELIRKEAMNWIRLMIRVLHTYRQRGRNRGSTTSLRKQAASHLAIALHSLQDSFSPGHTKRARYERSQYPGAIEDIYIYEVQDKHKHSQHDFDSGSAHSLHALSSVYASADLLRLCALSVSMKSAIPLNWNMFENRWLKLSSRAK